MHTYTGKRNPGTESKIRSGIFCVEKHGKRKLHI
ncbi:hypothetical protein RHOM_03000 [Roseburia hominis A2-183]|uniref:Uncharacterized protein n=1 Tax=Roseburia hominis (strain DSM 16839 / JCM 17582 / NCIMB 14029 / A2-183) TaxID=585394 RepID=G2T0P0_ROSHA|nr:hypothetical protein RHOM_03000 [Roseburia hominis A2-183]